MGRKIISYLIPAYFLLLILAIVIFVAGISQSQKNPALFPAKFFGAFLLFFALIIIGKIFTVWMIVDCALRNFKSESTKILWVVLLLLFGIFASSIYFYVYGKNPREKSKVPKKSKS